MGLQHTAINPVDGSTITNAYYNIFKVSGDKGKTTVILNCYPNYTIRTTTGRIIGRRKVVFDTDLLETGNIFEIIYTKIKTTPVFSGATDIIEE